MFKVHFTNPEGSSVIIASFSDEVQAIQFSSSLHIASLSQSHHIDVTKEGQEDSIAHFFTTE